MIFFTEFFFVKRCSRPSISPNVPNAKKGVRILPLSHHLPNIYFWLCRNILFYVPERQIIYRASANYDLRSFLSTFAHENNLNTLTKTQYFRRKKIFAILRQKYLKWRILYASIPAFCKRCKKKIFISMKDILTLEVFC